MCIRDRLTIADLIPTALGIVAEGCCHGDSLLEVPTIRTQSNLGSSIDRSVNLLGTLVNADNVSIFPESKSPLSLAFLDENNNADYIFYTL